MNITGYPTNPLLFRVAFLSETIHERSTLTEITKEFENRLSIVLTGTAHQREEIEIEINYDSKYFKEESIERLTRYYREIMKQATDAPGTPLAQLRLVSPGEEQRILEKLNSTQSPYPKDKTIQQLFEHQVAAKPGKTALYYETPGEAGSNGCGEMTYGELEEKANRLARKLQAEGVKPGDEKVVAIMTGRTPHVIAGMLAILKAGAAYMPIDPRYPPDRVEYLLEDSGAGLLLAEPKDTTKLENPERYVRIIDPAEERDYAPEPPGETSTPGQLAYIMYTSGSTGRPKGIMVEQRNVVRLVTETNYITVKEEDRLLLTGRGVFDITTFEIWAPLLNGAGLYLADENIIMDPDRLGDILATKKITHLHLIPQVFNQVAVANPELFSPLRYLLVGGDLVRPENVNRVREQHPELKILHMYGPTENTTFTTYHPVEKRYDWTIPIGKPVSNTTVYILDRQGNHQAVGAVGELCTGGEGVARGYLNNPELTAETFVKNEWTPQNQDNPTANPITDTQYPITNNRLYKTGDLARLKKKKKIEFLGRRDE
ncbi:MAG: amino acid adenylation domain-containing protein, partial [bacterium]|nr:amino acid adenylation domain-containing protein [bacterium]